MNWLIIELWLFFGGGADESDGTTYVDRCLNFMLFEDLQIGFLLDTTVKTAPTQGINCGIKAWHSPTAPLHEKQLVGLNWKQLLLSDGVTSWYTVGGSNFFGQY